jgi:hypothetical protein
MFKFVLSSFVLILSALLFISGCSNPTGDFSRNNPNDPLSDNFQERNVPGVSAEINSSGLIVINWWELSYSADIFLIEKSLGDSTSFEEIGRVDSDATQFTDNSGVVRGITFYRVSSIINDGEEEFIVGRDMEQLQFGELKNFSTEFLEAEKQLKISLEAEHPLFTHFRIISDKNISGVEGEPIQFESGETDNFFVDELSDITFSERRYLIEALIIGEGFEDVILQDEFSFNPGEYFFPGNLTVTPVNEIEWEINWEDEAFFADGYLLTKTVGGDIIEFELPGDITSFTDTTIVVTEYTTPIDNQSRLYSIRFIDKNGDTSQPFNRTSSLYINGPIISLIGGSNFENSINIDWMGVDQAAHSVLIERAEQEDFRPLEFEIIAEVEPNQDSYTDFNVDSDKTYHYRVRTLTSSVHNNVAVAYQEMYDVTSSITWDISFPARIESTSDGRFIAWTEGAGSAYTIKIFDLLNNQNHSEIVTDVPVRITDIKITPDEEFIYFAAPEVRAIYRAEFPSGNNITLVIENTDPSQDQFGFGIGNIDISPDGNLLAGTGGIGHFAMYARQDYSKLYTYSESGSHSAVLNINLAFSPVDDLIAINSINRLSLHNIADGSTEMTFPIYASSDQVGFSKEGTYVHTRDAGFAHIFNINNGSEFRIWGGYINSDPASDDKFLLGRQFIDIEQGRYNGTVGEFTDNSRVLGQTESILKFNFRHVNIWSKTGEERWNYLYEYLYNNYGFNEPHSR